MRAASGILEAARRGLRIGRVLALAAVAVAATGLGGCASASLDLGYYWQSVNGHLSVMHAAQPIAGLIDDPATDARLRAKLERVLEVRGFASERLALPENGSYTRYADLKRPFVIWNVFAAPRLSLELHKWCFPVVGCVSYRGYYSRDDAERYAQTLRDAGYDVYVAGVPAYSTLGWFDDPVLNTFIGYPDGELARLIFHELAHQLLYVKGDSTFNESFATTVEQVGVERWLATQHDPKIEGAYRQWSARRVAFVALLERYRTELAGVYASPLDDAGKLARKEALFAAMQADYHALKEQWGGFAGYDRWFAQRLGNAHLASVATYTKLVPGFRRLLADHGDDLPSFFAAARALARRDKGDRDGLLARLGAEAPVAGDAALRTRASADAEPRVQAGASLSR